MKTKLSLTVLLSFIFYLLSSQVPQGFNYQAIARDGSGNPISTPINVKIAILTSESDASIIWEEVHTGVDPDDHGLFSIVVGNGSHVQGLSSFNLIDWTVTPLYIRTKINDVKLGTAKLWSVPYAMVADSLGGPLSKLKVKGSAGSTLDEALFEVKNRTGQTIFAVYNEGVRIYVDDGDAKGAKGGFSVGGFGTDKAGESQPLLVVNPDSIRAYIYEDPLSKSSKGGFSVGGFDGAKGFTNDYLRVSPDSVRIYISKTPSTKSPKGGFSVGGFDEAKAPDEEYFRVTRDSTRVYVNEDYTKSSKGGFSVGGFDGTKGDIFNFLDLTPENYFVGHRSGVSINNGKYNSFVGYETGLSNTDGNSNVYLGYKTGSGNLTGSNNVAVGNLAGYTGTIGASNVFIGDSAGYGNTNSYNVFLGKGSGKSNTAQYNSFLGYQAGLKNTTGSSNVFIGNQAGFKNIGGSYNVSVGYKAGYSSNNVSYNTFLGYNSGYSNLSGESNVFLGYNSGYLNTGGQSNVFLGTSSGYSNTDGGGNVFVGVEAGYLNTIGIRNVFIGWYAGHDNKGPTFSQGSFNIFIGNEAGRKNTTGSSNVVLGNGAGLNSTTGYENIIIGNNAGQENNSMWNVFIGYASGYKNKTGSNNTYVGYRTGLNDTDGYNNSLFGSFSGENITTGTYNSFFGSMSGNSTTSAFQNSFFGYNSGKGNTTGGFNSFFGNGSGELNDIGTNNAFFGYQSGYKNNDGHNNTYIGVSSGMNNNTGQENTTVGTGAGVGNEFTASYSKNLLAGTMSGYKLTTGSRNVFLGYKAGYNVTDASDRLYIDNSDTDNPLIYGEFNSDILAINGKVGIGTITPSQSLEIGGTNARINLNSLSSNIILYNQEGVASPSFTTRSAGTKLALYQNVTGTTVDYALGVETNSLWYAVPQAISTYSHKFYAGTTELMRIRGDGRIGIGMDPSYQLDITGTLRVSGKFISSANGTAFMQGGDDTELRDVNIINTMAIYGIQNSDRATLRLGSSAADISGLSGNIGIGTTSPGYKLDVAGTANIRNFFILETETINVTATTGFIVVPSKSNVLLTASAASTLNTTTPIANGTTIGQILILRGSHATNTITVPDSGNTNLAGNRILGFQDTLTLMWDGTSWIQMAFASNTP